MRQLVRAICVVAIAACLTACGNSLAPTDVPPGPVAVSATRTGPAPIDYNNPSDLEAALRVQWTREMGDPKNAHYAPGVKVKSILCSRDVQPHTLRCRITPTRGEPKTNLYLASDDGHSFTGVGPGDS
jgi:hypothetical protein